MDPDPELFPGFRFLGLKVLDCTVSIALGNRKWQIPVVGILFFLIDFKVFFSNF